MQGAGPSAAGGDEGESARLQALASYELLDTPPDEHFDALARLAARLCNTPMAVVTLVDDHRQWFKSKVGLQVSETPRAIAFCAHTIEGTGLFQVPDARADARFANNPLVTGEPRLRFYAGVPLRVDGGHQVGALAVLDREPRQLTAQQLGDLESLAHQVVVVLEERRLRTLAELAATKARRQSDSLLVIAGRVARLGAWELDVARQRVVWSDVVADIHGMPNGYSPGLEEGLSFYVEPDRSALASAVTHCLQKGLPFDLELVLQPAGGGGPRWVRSIGEAVRNADGHITHLRGACQDITERKAAEVHREALERQLLQAQKMESIGTLAGGIAHDFNNILGAILGNVALAQDALPAGAVAHSALAAISGSAQRARSLVQQILAFGRLQATQRLRQPLQPLVDEAAQLLRSTLPANVGLETRCAAAELFAEVDANQLQQVLINLCTNAWHAMPPDGGRIVIGLDSQGPERLPAGARLATAQVHLWVEDDGCGIDPADQGRIFEPFFTTKPVGHGTGLGLSAAHGIVVAHGGAIHVESEPNQGSVFHIYLPACDAPAAGVVTQAAASTRLAPLQGLRVLCVDDDPMMLTTMQALLEREGCQVDALLEGQQALDRLFKAPEVVDLLVTDYNMPGMDGLSLVQAAKRLSPGLQVVMASGFLSDKLCEQAAQSGVHALVQKERTVEDLVSAVREAVALTRAQKR